MAILATIVAFIHVLAGFRNRQFTDLVGSLLGTPYSQRQATYDLRRLRRKGLIERLPNSHRYRPTPFGRAVAVLFLKVHGRVLGPAFSLLDAALPDRPTEAHDSRSPINDSDVARDRSAPFSAGSQHVTDSAAMRPVANRWSSARRSAAALGPPRAG